ncbi:hypothetical protein MJO47_14660 [Desulfuromonas sp. KJ2020]|uniref:hypothetical protein n=1 Tax=Desulfuromonas sp. KJ2020 TaxID=2919173 RepID=UPI0020A71C58|nr:hypothetical protein [Desulfuromonas sp. KJ2020]MCP3178344.1 hypothetical protein [Desulfuromonas sp. KJ2020]
MTKAKKITLLICSHLLVALICLGGAAYWFDSHLVDVLEKGNAFATEAALISRYAAFVETQRSNDYPEGYKEALLIFSEAVDQTKEIESPMFTEKSYYIDKTLIYVRLSRVENETGNTQKANEYLSEAQMFCENSGWKDCSKDHLIEISVKLEQNSLFSNSGT